MGRIVLLTCLALLGCNGGVTEYSGTLTEQGKVEAVVFTPSTHSRSLSPIMNFDGGVGLAFNSSSVSAKYGILFSCEHGGKFFVERKSLYDKLSLGDIVTITYREVYRTKYDSNDNVLFRVLVDYDFLDAEVQP